MCTRSFLKGGFAVTSSQLYASSPTRTKWCYRTSAPTVGRRKTALLCSARPRLAWNRSGFSTRQGGQASPRCWRDRKSTRLNSSHLVISYAVFCLKKKKKTKNDHTEQSADLL